MSIDLHRINGNTSFYTNHIYRGIEENTGEYRGIQENTKECRRIQGNLRKHRGYKGILGNNMEQFQIHFNNLT